MKTMYKKKTLAFMTAIFLVVTANHATGESSFDYYTNATSETLSAETSDMSTELKTVFSQGSVYKQQQKIDFAEYFSSLKKSALFATRLAVYSEYETDLRFARDNEVFKGLPEDISHRNNGPPIDRKDFVENKYGLMKKNIEEEIETYNDLILLSLDTCETLTTNDLSNILENEGHRNKINKFMQGKEYQEYQTRRAGFRERWPELENRMSAQFAAWRPNPPSADDPIIDPSIVGAL
jgi:hypothetical protein